MSIFLIDRGQVYTYDNLLHTINQTNRYYPLYRGSDIYLYFVNLIKTFVSNSPLVLLDSDVHAS